MAEKDAAIPLTRIQRTQLHLEKIPEGWGKPLVAHPKSSSDGPYTLVPPHIVRAFEARERSLKDAPPPLIGEDDPPHLFPFLQPAKCDKTANPQVSRRTEDRRIMLHVEECLNAEKPAYIQWSTTHTSKASPEDLSLEARRLVGVLEHGTHLCPKNTGRPVLDVSEDGAFVRVVWAGLGWHDSEGEHSESTVKLTIMVQADGQTIKRVLRLSPSAPGVNKT